VRLKVRTSVNPQPISPWIYGIDALHGDCADPNARFGLCRLGGNPYSTYNWENNASNAGSEDCSENNDQLGTSDQPAAPVLELLTQAGTQNAATLLTVPILDYVAADKLGGSPSPACSGDVRNVTNYLSTRFKQNFAVKNAPLSDPPEVTDGAVYQDEFVAFVKARAGDQQVLFSLDNQPELWDRTHAAVHAEPPDYAEVTAANIEYARMIRDNFADAKILGHGGYGYLAIRTLQDAEPRPNVDFVDFYLDALQEASAEQRLLDYYDVHWYSEINANGQRIIGEDSSPDSVRARVQATRSLWDPNYVEQSWVSDYNGGAIRLIPWLKDKLDRLYPGTKLALSEWSYGGHNHISGGLAVVDALGIFGREGVGLASLAVTHPDFDFALGGFAVFRNYDGAGAHFGDVSVSAESTDVANVAVYASKDSGSGKVVVIALNRSETTTETRLELEDAASYVTAKLFRLTQASPLPAAAGSVAFESGGAGLPLSLPAYSATVIVPEQ